MKNWNWLLIAWYLIPILGWAGVILIFDGNETGWYFIYATAIWTSLVITYSFWTTKNRAKDIKIMEDALINKEVEK